MTSTYNYLYSTVEEKDNTFVVTPKNMEYNFKTETKVPKTGIMLVGLGGNNGTTFYGGLLANKHNITWYNKKGL
jgi:myo-inositol-1-phosphate synthase